ncbi:MAG: SIMPL domain-containing protein [Alistipes sp.]|nr:SIMPL domain-containing protein [Alistipes sp.]
MKSNLKYVIIAVAIVVSAWLLGRAYTYKYRSQDTIVVTGLGETEFASDLIVWNGEIVVETQDVASGYAQLERNKQKVLEFITSRGVAAERLTPLGVTVQQIVFKFVNVYKQSEPVYNASGNYAGQRFTGYRLSQGFSIESSEVDKVENISREISALIAQGVSIEAYQPSYYYTKLDDVKLSLIEQASADARARAEKIAENAGTAIGRVASAKMGVFQITGANSNEEFSAGGSFNTTSRQKKARITMKVEYRVK